MFSGKKQLLENFYGKMTISLIIVHVTSSHSIYLTLTDHSCNYYIQ